VLSLALTFAGNAEDFDAVAEANFRTSLAELLGVNVTSVLLQVRSGSIVLDVRVFMSLPPASSLLTAASLSGALGVNITNIVSTYTILEIQAPSPPPPSPPPSPPPPSPPPSPPPPSMPPTETVRSLELLYEATGGNAWRNDDKWLSGEPCVDGWFGVHCCPQALPVLRGDDECTAAGGGATGVRTTQGSPACHSGSATGTALDLATCVVVKVLLPSNNLIGQIPPLIQLPFLQHLDLSGNALTGSLPSAADCFPRLTYIDLTQMRSWDDEGGVTGPVPEWLLGRLDFMAPLRLANNALDDPTDDKSAVAVSRLWQRCQTLGAEQCSGVPPIGCSAFNRQGQRYEVKLNGLECVRCPTPLEIIGLAGAVAFFVLLFVLFVRYYTRFMRKYPEYAKTHIASFMILVGHLQTLTIIGSLQLGWPLIIQEILASINLPLISYIPLPCILTDPVLKALLSYAETAIVLLLLLRAWLIAWRRREAATRAEDKREEAQTALEAGTTVATKAKAKVLVKALLRTVGRCRSVPQEVATDAAKDAAKAKAAADKAAAAAAEAEDFLSVLFSFLFTVGLRASVTLFMRYDEDQTRLAIARLVASLLWLFWLYLLWRFHWLLREARGTAREAVKKHAANSDAQMRLRLRLSARRARAAEAVRYLTQRYASDDGLSHGDFLIWADKQIDGPIRERLADGTIRLLRCAWLLSADSDKYLGRDASGRVIMSRRQELPEEAFVTNEEAVALFDGADRSILALSYRWLTREHPDPHGTALCAVRRFLRSDEAGLGKCAMFWDFTSLPQKDIAKEARGLPPRTPEEADTMKRGLEGMGYFYASACGTAVVQLKDIPPRPSEYDGRMIVFNEEYSEMTSKKDVVADLERFGGHITEIAIRPTVTSATHKQKGEAHVTFATHEQAERCIAALREVDRGAITVYNETAYSRDRGAPFSGWCTFEQGSSKLAAAHLNMASRQASKRSAVLPERLVRANASRAKVTDISDGQVRTVDVKESPATLLKQTNLDLEIAQFVGKGDSVQVKQLLENLEWSMNLALELATADHARKSDGHSRKSDEGLGPKSAAEGGVQTDSKAICAWWWPLRSQWQLVVWARQGLLFLLSFAMDCVMWFSPYEARRSARYVFATLAIAVLFGLWLVQAWRQPYAKRGQHWLETGLYAVDILAIVLACVYGALTNDDGTVQDGLMRRALELGLGALLGASVLFAALVVTRDYVRERSYTQEMYLEATQFFDAPIVAAIRDGAVRLIDYAWLLDSKRSDGQLPRVTKVVARLVSDEPTSVLIRRLATHCGTSSICITVETASTASLSPSPPPSPPEVAALAEVQLEDRYSVGHVTRLRHKLVETGLSQLAHAIIDDLGIESVEGLREFTFDELKENLKAEAGVALTAGHSQKLKAFLAASPSGTSEGRMPGGPKVAFSAHGLQQDAKGRCNTKHADAKLMRSLTEKVMPSALDKKSEACENDVESPHLDTSSAASSPGSGASGRFHSRRRRDSFAEDLTMEAASKSEHPSGKMTSRAVVTARSPARGDETELTQVGPKLTNTTLTAVIMAAKLRRRAGGDKTRRDLPTASYLRRPGAVGSGRMDHNHGSVLKDLDSRPAPLDSAFRPTSIGSDEDGEGAEDVGAAGAGFRPRLSPRGAPSCVPIGGEPTRLMRRASSVKITKRTNASPRQSSTEVAPNSALPSSHENTLVVTFHLSTFDEVAPLTAASLQGKSEAVKERLAELGAEDIEIVKGKPFLPRCQDMPADAFLSPERAADLFARGRRGVSVVSYCRRSPGVPDPDGRTLEKIRGKVGIGLKLKADPQGRIVVTAIATEAPEPKLAIAADAVNFTHTLTEQLGLKLKADSQGRIVVQGHVPDAPLASKSIPTGAFLEKVNGVSTAKKSVPEVMTMLTKGERHITLEFSPIQPAGGDRGLFVDVACLPQNFAWPSWHAPEAVPLRFGSRSFCGPGNGHFVDQGPLTVLKFECERVATEDEAQVFVDKLVSLCEERNWALASIADFESLGLRSHNHGSMIFHGRYISGVYHFDVGADAEGYMRFRTAGDADAARQYPKLTRMCGGKEPMLMGEHVFENELKSCRALSVMGSLYASATGTCVLQLTDPPGELGHDGAPSELVSERTGTVFVVEVEKELGDKSLDELQNVFQKELQMEIGDELLEEPGESVLACEKKGSTGVVVVRAHSERAVRAVRSLNERGYPLRRKDRVVYPIYNLWPYGSRGWPTFETSAASIVLAHLTQHKRRGGALPPPVAQAEASSPKLINIDLIGAPREVVLAQEDGSATITVELQQWAKTAKLMLNRPPETIVQWLRARCFNVVTAKWFDTLPERLLRECKKNLRSHRIFFSGHADRKQAVQLLYDFEDSIAVEFDQKRAEHLKLRTEELEHALTAELREARRTRSRKMLQRLTVHVEPMRILHVSEPTHTIHAVPKVAVATKAQEPKLAATPTQILCSMESLWVDPQKLPAPKPTVITEAPNPEAATNKHVPFMEKAVATKAPNPDPVTALEQRHATGSSVFVMRSNGAETVAYVKDYDVEKALYTVELERLGSGKFKKCEGKHLREANMFDGMIFSARAMFSPARVDDDLYDT
jgi:hypothetical protein